MNVRVKICGVRTLEAARVIRDAGADLAGLNFVPSSKRRVSELSTALEIASALGPVEAAGVFADQSEASILEVLDVVPLSYVQLHGREPPEVCAALAQRIRVIKAIPIGEDFAPAVLAPYRPHVAAFLFDGPIAGSGRAFAWDRLRAVDVGRPFFIAGGLTPENVAAAIDALEPNGVDTASGIEIAGAQDPDRIRAFVRAARGTE